MSQSKEKLDYIAGYPGNRIRAIERLGIPEIRLADGPLGVREEVNKTNGIRYAAGIAAASTWDRQSVYNMGVGIGQDCRARGVHILLGPGVNIYRAPFCSRNFEYFGEDPYLASQAAVQYIKGLQSQGVMACIKHYVANYQEYKRHHVSSDIDERTLHEIYLPAFRAAVKEAGVGSVMAAYNLINNVHASEHKYLTIDVLRKKWGFEGILVSDWWSTYSPINVANGGLDLEMPDSVAMNYQSLAQPIADGIVDIRTIDLKVQHILQTLISFGFFDRPQKDESISMLNPFSLEATLNVARNGIVMLKNDGILPLKRGKVAITGTQSNTAPVGGGSSIVWPDETVSVVEGMSQMKSYKSVNHLDIFTTDLNGKFFTSADLKTPGLKAEFFNNRKLEGDAVWSYVSTSIDHKWVDSPKAGVVNSDNFSARWTGVFHSKEGETIILKLTGDDGYRLFIDNVRVMSDWGCNIHTQRTYHFKAEAGRTGNYGLYDQLTAIMWVKHNIEAFGGDPDNITIMGQSAGAMSVQQHCLSPMSKGIFHKAVMCSGGGVSKMMTAAAPEKNYDFWHSIMERCGASTLEEFKKVPVEKLFKVWQENKKVTMGGGCSPCIDDELVVGAGHKILAADNQHRIPYLIGTTSHDVIPPILYSMAKKWCKKQDTPAYLWFFERNLPGDDHGAWHSSDLWYWFGTLENCWRPFTDKDRAISDEMSDRLCAFAKTGDPNTADYVEWHSGGKNALVLGDNDTVESNLSSFKLIKTMLTNEAPGE